MTPADFPLSRCLLVLAAALWMRPIAVHGADPAGETALPVAFGPIQPRVSPDGRKVVFSWQGAICVMPMTGGTVYRLTTEEGFDLSPAWSADGRRIAFVRSASQGAGTLQMLELEADDEVVRARPVPLPASISTAGPLHFHPDGRRLLGRFSQAGPPGPLGWYDLDTGQLSRTPVSRSGAARAPFCLSADGTWIVHAEHRDQAGQQDGNNGPHAELWRTPSDGGPSERFLTWPARIYALSPAARGQGVLAVTDRGVAHNDLWHLPFDEPLRLARKLTAGQADEDGPSSSPGPGRCVFTDNRTGLTEMATLDTDSGLIRTIVPDRIEWGVPIGRIALRIRDPSGHPLTARISIKDVQGKFSAPPGALHRILAGRGYFYCRDTVGWDVPAGTYELTSLRGPEYRTYQARFEVPAGRTTGHVVTLERWSEPAARGWYSGENHVHANYGYGAWYVTPPALLLQCEGENLNVCNAVVANSDGDAVLDREFFLGTSDPRSGPDTVLYWNEEFRSTIWGHLTLGGLSHLVEPIFTGFLDTTNPHDVPTNADIADRVRVQKGTVSYTHPASNPDDLYDRPYTAKGLPVDAALDRVDTLDVAGFGYHASLLLWYRLLNCGFRIPAAAGTDCFLNRMVSYPPGWARTYVKVAGGLDYRRWQEGQSAGRSFVTDGPMIELLVDDQEPGSTIRLGGPSSLHVVGSVRSQHPLDRLELIQDGNVILQGTLAPDSRQGSLDVQLPVSSTGWIALRTSGPAAPHLVGGTPWAHTNPVFVEIQDHPAGARSDAEYFLNWIDRLEAELRQRNRMNQHEWQVQLQLDAARTRYRKLAQP